MSIHFVFIPRCGRHIVFPSSPPPRFPQSTRLNHDFFIGFFYSQLIDASLIIICQPLIPMFYPNYRPFHGGPRLFFDDAWSNLTTKNDPKSLHTQYLRTKNTAGRLPENSRNSFVDLQSKKQ